MADYGAVALIGQTSRRQKNYIFGNFPFSHPRNEFCKTLRSLFDVKSRESPSSAFPFDLVEFKGS